MRDLTAHYSWVHGIEHLEAWTVAVVDGATLAAVLAAYGSSEDARIGDLTYEAAFMLLVEESDTPAETPVALFRTEGPRIVVMEPAGWTGTSHKVAREASREGAFFSVNRSSKTTWIVQADHGQILGSFDPMHLGSPNYPNEIVPEWVNSDDFERPGLHAKKLAAMESRSGLTIHRTWLDEPTPTYRITYPPDTGGMK